MTIQSAGYNGDITSLIWPTMQLSPNYYIRTIGDVPCTAVTGGTRQVTIGTGVLGGGNVMDSITAAETLTLPTVSSGTNYFMIVMRRNWSTNSSSLQIISAGTSNTVLPTRTTGPGVVDDQPLWLVPLAAGQTVPGTPIPLGVYGTGDGDRYILNSLALQYLQVLGENVWLQNTKWRCRANLAGTGIEWTSSQPEYDLAWTATGTIVSPATNWNISYAAIRVIGKTAFLRVSAGYNGAASITPNSAGDIANTTVGTVTSAYRFSNVDGQPLSTGATGRTASFVVGGTTGVITLASVAGTAPISNGDSFIFGGPYALD